MVGQQYKEWFPFFTIDTNKPQKLVLGNNGIAYQNVDKLPLFCVTSKEVVSTDFRKDIKTETNFAWFFVLSVTDPDTGLAKQYKTIKITAPPKTRRSYIEYVRWILFASITFCIVNALRRRSVYRMERSSKLHRQVVRPADVFRQNIWMYQSTMIT